MKFTRETILIIVAFFAIYIIWSSTYLLNKIAVSDIPPLFLSASRFIFSGIIIFIIATFLKIPLAVTKKQLRNNILAGFLFLVFSNINGGSIQGVIPI